MRATAQIVATRRWTDANGNGGARASPTLATLLRLIYQTLNPHVIFFSERQRKPARPSCGDANASQRPGPPPCGEPCVALERPG